MKNPDETTFDYLVIGSGFGGSVSAMRLAEKGYSVGVIEKGKEYRAQDFPKSNWEVRKFLWAPLLRCFGFQKLTFFREAFILSGVGVGGGSLVYANTHFVPPDEFFENPSWSKFANWKQRLEPFYSLARFMLGTTKNKLLYEEDHALKEVARDMGREHTFDSVNVGVYFGDTKTPKDPYFGGLGPPRKGCVECAACMVGCRYDAKNTLDKNYLWFARRFGAKVIAETLVTKIEHIDGWYHVHTRSSTAWFGGGTRVFKSKGLVVSGGVLGTMQLLLKQKYQLGTLPNLSDTLGHQLRTNSEMLCGVQAHEKRLNHGIALSSVFNPDENTHVEIVKYSTGSDVMGVFVTHAVGAGSTLIRCLQWAAAMLTRPHVLGRNYIRMLRRTWAKHSIIILVMQTLDNSMKMVWKRRLLGSGISIRQTSGTKRVPVHIPIGQEVMNRYAEKVGGNSGNAVTEVIFNMSTTAHILGGCPMGASADEGVINERFEVFGYPNFYVLDGSIVQGNLGVNPSLTITALSEYAMSLIPGKADSQVIPLRDQLSEISGSNNPI